MHGAGHITECKGFKHVKLKGSLVNVQMAGAKRGRRFEIRFRVCCERYLIRYRQGFAVSFIFLDLFCSSDYHTMYVSVTEEHVYNVPEQ